MTAKFRKVEMNPGSLLGIDLFRALPEEERAQIVRFCEGRLYAPQHEIVVHQDNSQDVYFVVSGKVQVTVFSASGKVITFEELEAGQMFGELSALDREPRVASVIAVRETFVVRISGPQFCELIWTHPRLAEATLLRLCAMVRDLCERVFQFHALPVSERIRAELLRLAIAHTSSGNRAVLAPAPTHADIASRVGTHREAVTRELSALTKSRLLERTGGELIVKDIDELRKLVEASLGS